MYPASRVGAMFRTAPAGRPKAAQSAALAQPLSADPTVRSTFAISTKKLRKFEKGPWKYRKPSQNNAY